VEKVLPERQTEIQAMKPEDLAFAAQCTANEGWASENYAVFEDFYRHDPQGCFIARAAGEAVGICVATPYEHSGFIGELIVRAEARRLGLGAALLDQAVSYLRQRGIQNIYLDGVVAAIPLYERHGFRKICRSLRFSGCLTGKQHPQVRWMYCDDLPQVIALDCQAFGDDRSFFLERRLERHPRLCLVQMEAGEIKGYLMGHQGDQFVAAGPGVSSGEAPDPLPLLETFACQAGGRGFSLGVLETNIKAAVLLRRWGFSERPDSPWRMALGPGNDLGGSPQCFAIGSAAAG
jgi:ribosomal protein S18 acetylase RimI-like enzyme